MWGLQYHEKKGKEKKELEKEGVTRRRRKPCEAYYQWIKIPSEPFLQYTGHSPERGGNSAAPYFPLTSGLYVFHPVLPQWAECLPLSRCNTALLQLKPCRPHNHVPEGQYAPLKDLHLPSFHRSDLTNVLSHACHNPRAQLVFCIINGFISTWTGGQSPRRAFMSAQPATKQSSLLPHSAKPHPSPAKREGGFITHFNKQHKTNSSARLFGGAADLTQACLN